MTFCSIGASYRATLVMRATVPRHLDLVAFEASNMIVEQECCAACAAQGPQLGSLASQALGSLLKGPAAIHSSSSSQQVPLFP